MHCSLSGYDTNELHDTYFDTVHTIHNRNFYFYFPLASTQRFFNLLG